MSIEAASKTPQQPSLGLRPPAVAGAGIKYRILALCDSPLVTTGFARVARNILSRWHGRVVDKNGHLTPPLSPQGGEGEGVVEVRCWAINFHGWDYDRSPFFLFPGGGADWNTIPKLNQFLGELQSGGYTHVWILMDPDALNVRGFNEELKRVCREQNIRSLLYFPVDAPLELEWLPLVTAVDAAVTYTAYGRDQARLALGKGLYPIEVVPHGIDEAFRPLPAEEREKYRHIELTVEKPGFHKGRRIMEREKIQFIKPGDFVILNVNKNEWRKDPLRSLEILRGLRREGVPAKLIMRMSPVSAMGGPHLELAAKQMGLTYGKEWCHLAEITSDVHLCGLYNAADLYLTTSMGEGWGLGVTEAMACHCPVAMAYHTSLAETGDAFRPNTRDGVIWLPMEEGFVCGADTRLRRRVDLHGAVKMIGDAYWRNVNTETAKGKGFFFRQAPAAGALQSWDAVAERMWKLLVKI